MTNGLVLYCIGCNEIISLIVFFFSFYKRKIHNRKQNALTFCLTEVDPVLMDWCLVDLDLQEEGRVVQDLKN